MLRIAHIVNPFIAKEGSDLSITQPITFESMRRAKLTSRDVVEVSLFSAQFEEDRSFVPHDFTATPDLKRSVLDQGPFSKSYKLPLISDILNRLYDASKADYFIFTNVDIVLHPDFYIKVNDEISRGSDAIIINRRRIPERYTSPNQIHELILEKGKKHPGFDCFIFARHLYPKFNLAKVCIGVPFIGITLSQNLFCHAEKFQLLEDEYLTFHIGMEIFKKRAPKEYFKYNKKEFWKAMREIKNNHNASKLPYFSDFLLLRLLKYGLHPSIPIRWVILLELKSFKTKIMNSHLFKKWLYPLSFSILF